MTFFKGKNGLQGIEYWLYKLQHKVDSVTVKHHIQLNVNIWTNNNNLTPSKKQYRFHIHKSD